MYLKKLQERNKALIDAAIKLHAEGALEANTYVIDVQALRRNAEIIRAEADKHGITLYGMTKQIGYNPIAHRTIMEAGIGKFVSVDWLGARLMREQGVPVGHVGHLVQAPQSVAEELVALGPEAFTVFSLRKAASVAEAAAKLGVEQNVLLRVYKEGDRFYPGHEGGFQLKDVVDAAREISKLKGVRVIGTTAFPSLLYNEEAGTVLPTPNFQTAVDAAARLSKELGIDIRQINTPGSTSSAVIGKIAEHGGTHAEPGHGLTGSTPISFDTDIPETPAMLYLSEISHEYGGNGHMFGGGLYVDRVRGRYMLSALVGASLDTREVELIPDDGIDYYGYVRGAKEGEPVILGFRAQIFVTRGQVAAIDGVQEGKPRVIGYHDAMGRPVQRGV
ncbi:alanine racemase [Paenibacillus sp. MSJ-34]|uniref:alanine racemase n=1 Tax=Paenibacillus sp. MSJ-34 TaxID=2841529 RepID=UPI001C10F3EE|nr:alanine racemase [Paenibacillus sp. MSJ-34]MBU5442549.1 alanine racemase [Paenibacillus sp. MSJ-34]